MSKATGTFRGGIHPADGKSISRDKAVRMIEAKEGEELVFPLSQHIGAPAIPTVAKGDPVKKGQIIAQASGFISAPIASSISGTVKTIEPRLTAAGSMVDSIVIISDGLNTKVEGFGTYTDPQELTKEEIVERIKAAGIVGMGGAGFPTFVKMSPKEPEKIDYVLINGAECEPYLTSDYRMMIEQGEDILEGLLLILKLFPNAEGLITIEENKPEAIDNMRNITKGISRVRVFPMKTKYPQGGERNIVYAATGRKLNSSMLPADAGCIVTNIDTCIAINLAVTKNMPLVKRIITITGDAVKDPCNFEVPLGMNYQRLIQAAGGFLQEPEKIISGGPMMGQALFSVDVPVTKTSSALTCFTRDEVAKNAPTPCIRCGRCVGVCPCGLVPQKMVRLAMKGDYEGFEQIGGMECYECGSCTYVCPAKRPLTQSFKLARRTVMAERKKAGGAKK